MVLFLALLILVASKKDPAPIFKSIWIKEISFKISFFMWRLLKRKLPLDNALARFRINSSFSSCSCCRDAKQKNANHLFADSDLAKQTWTIISRPLGFRITSNDVTSILWQWWRQQPKNIIQIFLLLIIPLIVCWEIWKARCTQRFEQKGITASNICFNILFQVKMAMGKKCKSRNYT